MKTLVGHQSLTAAIQIALSVVFIGGYFGVLLLFMYGVVRVPVEYKEAFIALLGVITASVVGICNFWFARQRPNDPLPLRPPEPPSTT